MIPMFVPCSGAAATIANEAAISKSHREKRKSNALDGWEAMPKGHMIVLMPL